MFFNEIKGAGGKLACRLAEDYAVDSLSTVELRLTGTDDMSTNANKQIELRYLQRYSASFLGNNPPAF